MSRTTGAVFFRRAEGITTNTLLKKLREDATTSDVDPRSLSGWTNGDVGLAIHPPKNDWWALVDSADGAPGIGGGSWSRVAIMANHLGTLAVWVRYFAECAIAVHFDHGGSALHVHVGSPKVIRDHLDRLGCPQASPPSTAGSKAALSTLHYAAEKYRQGPTQSDVQALVVFADALRTGDESVRRIYDGLQEDTQELALGMIRVSEEDATLFRLAKHVLDVPTVMRSKPLSKPTFEEVLLARAAVRTTDDPLFNASLDRLEDVERDALAKTSHSHPRGVEHIGVTFYASNPSRAARCYHHLATRPRPAYHHVNHALGALLTSSTGPMALNDTTTELLAAAEARLPDLGVEARHMIQYNLACVYARCGRLEQALDHLESGGDPRAQNPHPELDTDLAPLHAHPRFSALLSTEVEAPPEPDEIEAITTTPPPPERAVPRLDISLTDADEDRLVSRLGGRPNAPHSQAQWPATDHRPMDFVLQLVGQAGGGTLDLGDVHLIQVFADLEGDFWDDENVVLIHREPCLNLLDPPLGCDLAPIQEMSFSPAADDSLLHEAEPEDEEAYENAYTHAFVDKIDGIPTAANLEPEEVRDSRGRPMRGLLSLYSYDDWFLWFLFVDQDLKEASLEVVR